MTTSTGSGFVLVVVFALGAGLANALTSVFQRMGVEDAPEDATLRLSLLTHALRRGRLAVRVCSYGRLVPVPSHCSAPGPGFLSSSPS